jgi:hypothetical protein
MAEGFRRAGTNGKYHGAKFALNPGVKALEWVWLKKYYPEAKFIFITRDRESTWNSYVKQDSESVRGLITKTAYMAEVTNILRTYRDKGITISYESLRERPDRELKHVWDYLQLKPLTGLQKYIKQPEF